MELGRKILHIFFGTLVFLFVYFFGPEYFMFACMFIIPLGIAISLIIKFGYKFPLASFFVEKFGRKEELIPGFGTIAFFLGAFSASFIALIYRKTEIAYIALLPLIFGDGVATVVGKKFGKHKFLGKKSIEGSLACFIASFISVYLFCFRAEASLILALIATIVETLPIEDNITIPIVCAFILGFL